MGFEQAMKEAGEVLWFSDLHIDPAAPQGLWFCDSFQSWESIRHNAVYKPDETPWDDLVKCRSFFSAFPYIVVVSANAIARKYLVDQIRPRLSGLCIYVLQDSSFRGCQSVRDYVQVYGEDHLLDLLEGAEELPAYGLLNLAKVERRDMSKVPRTISRFKVLDAGIGGFFAGEISLWTGKAGIGKSTILGQMLLEAIEQGHTVCAYSGELDKDQFRDWIYLQAAGPQFIQYVPDPVTGKKMAQATALADQRISEWLNDRFWLFDLEVNTKHDPESIFSQFEYAHMRYGADVFLVDNVMTVDFRGSRDRDFYRAQSDFGLQLASWAKRKQSHVHLVVHPDKSLPDELSKIELGHVSGSADLTRAANNVFFLSTHAAEDKKSGKLATKPILKILKNRRYGAKGYQWLDFDKKSRRYFVDRTGDPNWSYGWDPSAHQMEIIEDTADIDQVFPAGG